MTRDDIAARHAQNRLAWNEAAARYEEGIDASIAFLRAGGTNFGPPEYRYLTDLSSWCHRAIHLQCAGGQDTLSLWNLGAHEVVGVDISDRMIAVAQRKAEALGAPAQWFCADVLQTPAELDGTADLVYTGRGALCWLMDLSAWAATIVRLLKPGGKLSIYEGHPLDWIWDLDADTLRIDPNYGGYFHKEIVVENGWPEQYIGDLGHETSAKHERQWTLGDIVTTLVDAGLRLVRLEEHPDRYWDILPRIPDATLDLTPHTFSLWMTRDDTLTS
jgi:SAM-dependent methyltransferase